MALPKIVQEIINQVSAVDPNGDTMAGKLTTNKVIQSNAVASDVSLSRIPSEGEIALQTGNGNGGQSAWIWRENYSSSNWGIFHDNAADILHIVGSSTSRFSVKLGDGTVTIPGNLIVNGTITGNLNYLPLSGGTLTGQLKLKGNTANTNSIYQWDDATYRNPSQHEPEMIIRADNATTGIGGYRPGLVLYNNYGDQNITVGLSFASKETTSSGNSVMLGGIACIKESAGTSGGWSVGGLRFLTKNMRTLTEAMTITGAGNIGIGTTAPTYKLQVNGTALISNTLTASGKITANAGIAVNNSQPGITITTATAVWSYIRFYSGSVLWDVAVRDDQRSGGLQFRPSGTDKGAYISTTGQIYGAVWNDYAEYRNQIENIQPGYCVASADDGKVYKTTKKFQACDGIVSDTFGYAIGETDDCKTPLAVAGRVLAYCEGNRYDYHAGDTVCATADGLVSKMTKEEIKEYPDRIVGIVSEIPEYETWGTGNVKVDGRIWIRIK